MRAGLNKYNNKTIKNESNNKLNMIPEWLWNFSLEGTFLGGHIYLG